MTLLRAISITKSFSGVEALKGASFELREAEVHALVGENGAGKSTLIKIITGALPADSGRIEVNGRVVENNSPVVAKSLGIAAIYQQPALFPDLTVTENITLGLEEPALLRRVNWRKRRQRASELLERIGARIDPDANVRNLSMPEQQMVEIGRALGANARVLIMDEPTASLTQREVDALFDVIQELRAHRVGIVYISHRLDELFEVADRVTVLRDGVAIATCDIGKLDHRTLIRMMVGRELSAVFPKRRVRLGETVLETSNLGCSSSGIRNVSLSVRAGEILGLAGLVGSGRTELARILFGLTRADTGQVLLRGREVNIEDTAQAVALGIAYVPEDRRQHGVTMGMSVASNITLAILRSISRFGFLDFEDERSVATEFVQRLRIKTPSIFAPVADLSGGNQQKVSLGRWLATEPAVIILDEPTQGIDVGAKWEVYKLVGDLAESGKAILMISSELPEVLGMSDRIAVMKDGTVVSVLDRAEATQQRILALALGHATTEVKADGGTPGTQVPPDIGSPP